MIRHNTTHFTILFAIITILFSATTYIAADIAGHSSRLNERLGSFADRSFIHRRINPGFRQVYPSDDKEAYQHRAYMNQYQGGSGLVGRFRDPYFNEETLAPAVATRYFQHAPTQATARDAGSQRSWAQGSPKRYRSGYNFQWNQDVTEGGDSLDDLKNIIKYQDPSTDYHLQPVTRTTPPPSQNPYVTGPGSAVAYRLGRFHRYYPSGN